jgi:hypothetical protein
MELWPDFQFPTIDIEAWKDAVRDWYEEFDSNENVPLRARATSIAVDSGSLGESIVYVTNNAARLRAQMTIAKANGGGFKGIVAYESRGYVFAESTNIRLGKNT